MRALLRNPVLRYELHRMAHRRRTFIGRFFLLLFAAGAAGIAILIAQDAMVYSQDPAKVISDMGNGIFYSVIVTAWIVIVFVVPGFAAGLFAREKDKGTLPLLLVTDLSDLEIVQAKVMAGLAAAGFAVLGVAPVIFLCMIFGGVSWLDVVGQFSILLGLLCFCCGAGIYYSATCANASIASSRATGLCLLAVIWPPILLAVTQLLDLALDRPTYAPLTPTLCAAIAFIQPLFGAISVGNMSAGGRFVPGWVAQHAWISASLVCVGWFVLFCRMAARQIADREAVLRVKTTRRRSFSIFRRASEKAGPADRPTDRVWDNPVMWHAWRTAKGASGWWVAMLASIFVVINVVSSFYVGPWEMPVFNSVYHWVFIMIETLIACYVLVGPVAQSIAPEREKKTLPMLLLTDLEAREIVGGKAGGIVLRLRWLILLPVIHAAAIAAFRLVGWITPALLALDIAVFGGFLLAWSLLCSLHLRKPSHAVSLSQFGLLLLAFLMPMCMGIVFAWWIDSEVVLFLWAGMWTAMSFKPLDVDAFKSRGTGIADMTEMGGYFGYAGCLLLYAVLACVMFLLVVRTFDKVARREIT
ncbi:MAG: ABC transporter permease subunit [Planctomycetota bacterium]